MALAAPLLAGIELGGTKCVCLIGTGPHDVRMQTQLPTGADPEATLQHIEDTLREAIASQGPIAALGIASFGPVDLHRASSSYGSITTTPKPGWQHTAIVPRMANAFAVPIGFDTDVDGAALAEGRWGAAQGLTEFAYVTVGTGIGVGLIVAGRPVLGFNHPELGHIRTVRRLEDSWPGSCPFHGDCLEGLASGPAIAARTGLPPDQVPADHPVWELTAHALAQLLHTLVLTAAPRRVLIGGGVIEARPQLLQRIRQELLASLNGYLDLNALAGGIDAYATRPGLGSQAGPLGALALAADAFSVTIRA